MVLEATCDESSMLLVGDSLLRDVLSSSRSYVLEIKSARRFSTFEVPLKYFLKQSKCIAFFTVTVSNRQMKLIDLFIVVSNWN